MTRRTKMDSKSPKYFYLCVPEALKNGFVLEEEGYRKDDYYYILFRNNADGTRSIIFEDRMEPEDAILCRDLKPLVNELNRLSEENN